MAANENQVGGNHYKEMAIDVIEFCRVNDIGFIEGKVIKYVCRHKRKGGMTDLLKAKHYLQILIDNDSD